MLLRHRAVRKNTHAGLDIRDHVQWITAAAASSCMQWIKATAAPSCGQKKHTRWRNTIKCNELPLLLRHRAVTPNTHAGLDITDHVQWITAAAASSCMQWIKATAAPSCGQKKHTRWRNTITCNELRCCCAIVRSEKTHTLALTLGITCNELPLLRPRACNELKLLLRHRAVRKNTHAGEIRSRAMNYDAAAPSCGQKKHTCWPWHCNELPLLLRPRAWNELKLLLRHRAVRKNTHVGLDITDHVQWITAAAASSCMQWIKATAAPSCGQKKHTRWPWHYGSRAMNYRCCCVLVHAMN